MPWSSIKLNDGRVMPSIAFGSWTAGFGQTGTDSVVQALKLGFNHVDTAQMYGNEEEVGNAIRQSGRKRSEIYVTTKFSGYNTLEASIDTSLKKLGVSYVDLYLIHRPSIAHGDIPGLWAKLEDIKRSGQAKSIGVSNFGVEDLTTLLERAKIKPAVNQIIFNPYEYTSQSVVHAFGNAHGIVTMGYYLLLPITKPGGPLDQPLKDISKKLNVAPDQVILAWVKAKGVGAVAYSSKAYRLSGYLEAGDIKLSAEDQATIEEAAVRY